MSGITLEWLFKIKERPDRYVFKLHDAKSLHKTERIARATEHAPEIDFVRPLTVEELERALYIAMSSQEMAFIEAEVAGTLTELPFARYIAPEWMKDFELGLKLREIQKSLSDDGFQRYLS